MLPPIIITVISVIILHFRSFKQPVEAPTLHVVEVFVGVVAGQHRATQPTEVSVAFRAVHLITAVDLLDACSTFWTTL